MGIKFEKKVIIGSLLNLQKQKMEKLLFPNCYNIYTDRGGIIILQEIC